VTKAAVVVCVVSGGLDSSVLAHHVRAEKRIVRLLSFDYGQRHAKELEYAALLARDLRAQHDVVDLRSAGALLSGSALTDERVDVPDGHYTDESMKATVVANRNAIFVNVAVGVAVASKAWAVAVGIHAGDHPIYPDCRPPFVAAAEHLAKVANEGFIDPRFRLQAPFLEWTKADIVRRGAELGVDFTRTWSCYKGGAAHCGTCGTCVERREAFDLAGLPDPTVYAAAA
jgi:7-cyano-7-deazaguanine synthase